MVHREQVVLNLHVSPCFHESMIWKNHVSYKHSVLYRPICCVFKQHRLYLYIMSQLCIRVQFRNPRGRLILFCPSLLFTWLICLMFLVCHLLHGKLQMQTNPFGSDVSHLRSMTPRTPATGKKSQFTVLSVRSPVSGRISVDNTSRNKHKDIQMSLSQDNADIRHRFRNTASVQHFTVGQFQCVFFVFSLSTEICVCVL